MTQGAQLGALRWPGAVGLGGDGTFLVVQWLRICLLMQGTQVQFLVGKILHAMGQLSLCATTTESML